MHTTRTLIGFCVLSALAGLGTAHAQTTENGVKGGLSIASALSLAQVGDQISGLKTADTSAKFGWTGGIFMTIPLTPQVSFQPELMLTMKGAKLNATNGSTVTATLRYVEMPLLLRFGTDTSRHSTIYAMVGPSLGLRLSNAASVETPAGTSTELALEDTLRRPDLGVALGLGVTVGRFLLEGRHTAGLIDIATSTRPHIDSVRNQAFVLLFGFTY